MEKIKETYLNQIYTFLMDYESRDYVFQVEGEDLKGALLTGLRIFDFSSINVGNGDIEKAIYEVNFDEDLGRPTLLDESINVWCITFLFNDELAIIDIVKTDLRDG